MATSAGGLRGVDRLRSVLQSTNSVLSLDVPFIFNGQVKSASRGGDFSFLVLPGGDIQDRVASVRKYISTGLGGKLCNGDVSILVSCVDSANVLQCCVYEGFGVTFYVFSDPACFCFDKAWFMLGTGLFSPIRHCPLDVSDSLNSMSLSLDFEQQNACVRWFFDGQESQQVVAKRDWVFVPFD